MTVTAPRPRLAPLMIGALLVGAFDITFACTYWHLARNVPPIRVFQSVAAGLLGRDAFTGGLATAALGGVLHWFIASGVVAVYFLASGKLPALTRRPVLFGALYGIAVYFVMTYVVVALSAAPPPRSWSWTWFLCSLVVHAFLIGVTSALAARSARHGTAIGAAATDSSVRP
jgi:hypothetical protein